MSRRGTDRRDFSEFYPDTRSVRYMVSRLLRASPGEITGVEIRLMRKADFYELWGSEAVSGKDGVYVYFGDRMRPWGCASKEGRVSMTYCFNNAEIDGAIARGLESLGKDHALMLNVSRGD